MLEISGDLHVCLLAKNRSLLNVLTSISKYFLTRKTDATDDDMLLPQVNSYQFLAPMTKFEGVSWCF